MQSTRPGAVSLQLFLTLLARSTVFLFAGAPALVSCANNAQQGNADGPGAPADGGAVSTLSTTTAYVASGATGKVDVLFMVDNSDSDPLQQILASTFPQFVSALQPAAKAGLPIDLHVGVVTSDYGAGATGAPGCTPSPGGQQGRLQAIGIKAPNTCQPPVDAHYMALTLDGTGTVTGDNLPASESWQDLFSCMTSVGASGCGFEHPLESVYAALSNDLPDNQGFLRDDALLVIVFLTDEDDASAPPDTDVFDKTKIAQYGYEDDYSRQTRFAVVCCPPGKSTCAPGDLVAPPYGDSMGPLSGCQGAPNDPPGAGPGKQYDVNRYVTRFTQPAALGGLKPDPSNVILVGITAPEAPFQVILSNPGTLEGVDYQPCGTINITSNPPCVPVLQHSCHATDPAWLLGDPAVRLNQVIRAAPQHEWESICDGNYDTVMRAAANRVVATVVGCLRDPLRRDDGGVVIDCKATDVTWSNNGTSTETPIPACSDVGGKTPCFRVEPKPACATASPDGLGLTVDRGGQPAPANTSTVVVCATQ